MANLSLEEQEKLLESTFFFIDNRYRVTKRLEDYYDKSKGKKTLKILSAWQMTHMHSGSKSTWVWICYDDNKDDNENIPVESLEALLLCQ